MGTEYEKKYNDLMGCLRQMHERNVKRTSTALKSLIIVPTIFLVMLLMTSSSKTIFLVLWVASMFIIATVLIVIEYQDYTLRKMVADIEDADRENSSAALPEGAGEEIPRVEAIRAAIRSRSPEYDGGEKSFEYDNPREETSHGAPNDKKE